MELNVVFLTLIRFKQFYNLKQTEDEKDEKVPTKIIENVIMFEGSLVRFKI